MVKLTLEIANLVGFKALKDFAGYLKQYPKSGAKIQQEYDDSIEEIAKVIVACVVADDVNPSTFHVAEEKKEIGMQQRIKSEMLRLKNQQLANETIDISETDDEMDEDTEVYVPIKSQARPVSPKYKKLDDQVVAQILTPPKPCEKCTQLKNSHEKQLTVKNVELLKKTEEIAKLKQELANEIQEKTILAKKNSELVKEYGLLKMKMNHVVARLARYDNVEKEMKKCAEQMYEVTRKRMRE